MNELKVFHGISGAAGQPATIVAALRSLGVGAENYVLGENKYNYSFDRQISYQGDLNEHMFELLSGELKAFDVYHFYFRPLFFDPKARKYPHGLDLVLLKLMGKKLIMNFRGSEVRVHSEFKKRSPYNYVDEDPDNLISSFPENQQIEHIKLCNAICDHVLVPDPELQGYVPGSTVVPRAIDLKSWRFLNVVNERPLIVHAPSRRTVKGTADILSAVATLREEGLEFDFELIEGMSNEDARAKYEKADVIVDQLRIGWYGVLAVEGMALGKTVVSYVRDDLLHYLGKPAPLAVANPSTILTVLRDLIVNPETRKRVASQGRRYCEEVHDSEKVANQLLKIYQADNSQIEEGTIVQLLSEQYLGVRNEGIEQKERIRGLERALKIEKRQHGKTKEHLVSLQHKLRHLYWLKNFFR